MNSGGEIFTLVYGSESYYFNELKITVSNKTADSALVGGELYRVRSSATGEIVYLKARINNSEIFSYRTLLNNLASDSDNSLTIDEQDFSGYTLLSGKVYTGEGECFSVCEITLVKVDG